MRSYRTLLNFTFSFGRNIVGTLLSLVTTPLILTALGEERFGAFRILLDWLSHFGILELGLFSASLALLSKSANEGKKSLNSSIHIIFKNYFFVFLLQITAFTVFSFLIKTLIPVSPELQNELRTSALIMSISLLFLISQVFKAFLESAQKGYIVSLILVVFNISYLGLATYLAQTGYGLVGQTLAYVISLFLSLILFLFYAPEVITSLLSRTPSAENSLLLKKQRFSHFINELCGRISLMSDNIIISIFMGASTVTAFFITQKVGSMMQQQLQHLSNSSWAALSELYYQKKYEIFNQRILNLTELIAFCSGVVLSVVCIFNPAFVALWTGPQTYAGAAVSYLTAVNAALFSILSLWSWCFAATNLTQKMVTMSIVQGTVNIIASIVLTKMYGISGPLWGTLIGYSVVSMGWKSWVLSKTFSIDFSSLTLCWARPLLPPFILAFSFISFYGEIKIDSWLKLIFFSITTGGLLTLICYFLLLSQETKKLIKEKLHLIKIQRGH